MSVKVDGKVVDEDNYTVTEGSTIITLKPDYLKALSKGSHTFEIVWTDGSARTSYSFSRAPFITLFVVVLAGTVVMTGRRKKSCK